MTSMIIKNICFTVGLVTTVYILGKDWMEWLISHRY